MSHPAQRRPITPQAVPAVAAGLPNVLPQNLSTENIDEVRLFINNTTAGTLRARVVIASGAAIDVDIGARTTVLVLDDIPCRASASSGAISVNEISGPNTAGLVAFGSFVRT